MAIFLPRGPGGDVDSRRTLVCGGGRRHHPPARRRAARPDPLLARPGRDGPRPPARQRHAPLRGRALRANRRGVGLCVDAETGHQLWSQQIGLPEHPSMPLSACEDLLAVVNGSRLYVCNRFNGQVVYQAQVNGSPSNGAALSEKFVYVPTASGTIIAYRLDALADPAKELGKVKKDMTAEEKAAAEAQRRENIRLNQEYIPPLACQSGGKTLIQPTIAAQNHDEEFVAWPTDRGCVTIGRIDRRDSVAFTVKLELQATAPIEARLAYLPPDPKVHNAPGVIFAAPIDGNVFAMSEQGAVLWRFPAAEPVIEPPAVLDGRVLRLHSDRRPVLPRREERQAAMVGPGDRPFRRRQPSAGVCRRPHRQHANPRPEDRRAAG